MKRSEINRLQREAAGLFASYRFALPPFALWGEDAWRGDPEAANYCRQHQSISSNLIDGKHRAGVFKISFTQSGK